MTGSGCLQRALPDLWGIGKMAKQKAAPVRDEKRAAADYYKLNRQAVEDLVTADETNSPPVSEEELRRYTSGPKVKMSHWLKIALIKAWFFAAVCYFFLWGAFVSNVVDQIVITGIALGFVIDILVNNLLRFMEKTPGANNGWMLVSKKGFVSLPLNVVYGLVLIFCGVQTYEVINRLLVMLLNMPAGEIPLGVGPILFGILTMGWDALFLLMKRTLRRIVEDAKAAVKR